MIAHPALTTGLLATLSVSLWTLRVALTARNHKMLAAATASVEATVFALAFSRLLSGLDSSSQVISYAVGVGIGTLVGLAVNERVGGTSARPQRLGIRTGGAVPRHESEDSSGRVPVGASR